MQTAFDLIFCIMILLTCFLWCHFLFVRGRRYGEAVTAWGRLKRARLFNVETYHLMFRLCQGLGSGEATNVVRRDMAAALTGQDKDAVTMNLYFQALVDSRCLNQAIDFVKDTELKVTRWQQ